MLNKALLARQGQEDFIDWHIENSGYFTVTSACKPALHEGMSKGKGGETQKMKVGRFGLEFDLESKRSPELFAWNVAL
jgi:hypothetical protein